MPSLIHETRFVIFKDTIKSHFKCNQDYASGFIFFVSLRFVYVYAYKLILECLDLGFTVLSKRRIGLLLNDVTHRRKFIDIKSHFEEYI